MRLRKIFCPQLPVILSDDAVLVKRMTRSTFQRMKEPRRSDDMLGTGVETVGRDTSLGAYGLLCHKSHNNGDNKDLDHRGTRGGFREKLVF